MGESIRTISRVGSKAQHLDFILPLLPATRVYVEPFGGSAAVLLNRPRSEVEVYSDAHRPLCLYMSAVRDQPDTLRNQLNLTPWSRKEFELAQRESKSKLEAARRMFILSVYGLSGDTTWWGRSKQSNSMRHQAADSIILQCSKRLQGVRILSRDVLEVIAKYDSPDTLFYLDPPYMGTTQKYSDKFSVDDWTKMAEVLNGIKGRAAVSGYNNDIMQDLFPPDDWICVGNKTKTIMFGVGINKSSGPRTETESVWCNYEVKL